MIPPSDSKTKASIIGFIVPFARRKQRRLTFPNVLSRYVQFW